jgi:DNA-binding beta-propeller fold protein YncE
MSKGISIVLALAVCLIILQMGISPEGSAQGSKGGLVVSDQTVTGFVHPESVAYDPQTKVLYVGQFGSVLKPTLKDGKGKIRKVSLTGEILEARFLPAPGEILNKPKGIWVEGNRLWVTDIDVVWIFDLKTRRGRKAALPGVKFANDPTVMETVLFVSDNRGDQIYRVEPADFLDIKGDPEVTVFVAGESLAPNGLFPARDGLLLAVGFMSGQDRGIYSLDAGGKLKALSKDIGRLDGVVQLDDGTLLVTDWKSRSLFRWGPKMGMEILATGFKGPADFCVVPEPDGYLVVVPDLVKSELRMIRISK